MARGRGFALLMAFYCIVTHFVHTRYMHCTYVMIYIVMVQKDEIWQKMFLAKVKCTGLGSTGFCGKPSEQYQHQVPVQ